MTSPENEYGNDHGVHCLVHYRILLNNLRRLQPLLWGVVILTALLLICSHLLRDRAVEDFGSAAPLQGLILLRTFWLGTDLLALFTIGRFLARKQEQITYLHSALESGTVLANMLFVAAMVNAEYSYNPSLDVLYIALFALAPVIRLNLTKSLLVIGLPCLLLLLAIVRKGVPGIVHTSNIINLIAITILALIIFRVMFLSGERELSQQLTIEHQFSEMEHLAITDGLTQLPNRRRFNEHLEMEWRKALRAKTSLALVMMDIDHFKDYNDLYGHLAGDDCLKAVASVIEKHTQLAGDMGARYGGEEFAILLPGADLAGAARVAESVRQEVLAMGHQHAASSGRCITASLGVACTRSGAAVSAADLLGAADQALYEAKALGRNRVAMAGSPKST